MGEGPSKPEVIGDDAKVHCDTDNGFKLIQITLDWNNNGDGVTAASIIFIMLTTVLLMFIIRKLYNMWQSFRRQRRRKHSFIRYRDDIPMRPPAGQADEVEDGRQDGRPNVPRVPRD